MALCPLSSSLEEVKSSLSDSSYEARNIPSSAYEAMSCEARLWSSSSVRSNVGAMNLQTYNI
jgi:hypothetical protein